MILYRNESWNEWCTYELNISISLFYNYGLWNRWSHPFTREFWLPLDGTLKYILFSLNWIPISLFYNYCLWNRWSHYQQRICIHFVSFSGETESLIERHVSEQRPRQRLLSHWSYDPCLCFPATFLSWALLKKWCHYAQQFTTN